MKTCFSCKHFLLIGGRKCGFCHTMDDTLHDFDDVSCNNYEEVDSDKQFLRNKKLLISESLISKICMKNDSQSD